MECLNTGKHLIKEGTIMTSWRTSKHTCKAKICMLGMIVLGLTLVPTRNVSVQMQYTESEINIARLIQENCTMGAE
jgi:hypothetical protein